MPAVVTAIMVALDTVNASNARLRELGPGLVALFGAILYTAFL